MAALFMAGLGISIIGLILLITIKRWELRTGNVLFGSVRPRADVFFRNVLLWVCRILPRLVKIYTMRAARTGLAYAHRGSAWALLEAERKLEQWLAFLRHSTDPRRLSTSGLSEASSAFLREVAEHKRKLLKAQSGHVRLHKE